MKYLAQVTQLVSDGHLPLILQGPVCLSPFPLILWNTVKEHRNAGKDHLLLFSTGYNPIMFCDTGKTASGGPRDQGHPPMVSSLASDSTSLTVWFFTFK